ncbi:glycoside hydrolase family 19 protein [Algivirga pacifica]|uniref:Glycoside hydrolase family 19 catalytic domain-containing protein n=1 Tax=Algivirga pacifica TaxID=1162670 RepID=A0ABP9D710_9BACT
MTTNIHASTNKFLQKQGGNRFLWRSLIIGLFFSLFITPVLQAQSIPMTEAQYNELFPYRFGTEAQPEGGYALNPAKDFFTYDSFLEAIERMKNIKVIMERRTGTNLYKVTRINKTTGEEKLIRTDSGFDDSWNAQKSIVTKEVDYALFLNEGDTETITRELAAFLANISQETTGGWSTAPGGKYAWGLYFREEVDYANNDELIGYVEANHPDYPPTAGKSYHGRGPIQLSWNYNYGQVSQFLYGDKSVLLDNPDLITEDAALAFQTAIWFWMTPQFPKPSCHDVMVGNWVPTSYDLENKRFPGFGVTVNIINGGLECGSGTEKSKVLSRIGHYERHSGILNVTTDLNGGSSCDACGCANQKPFSGIEPEPTPEEPRISILSPTTTEIRQENFEAITISVSILDKDDQAINDAEIAIDGTVVSTQGVSYDWTPSAYGTYSITISAADQAGNSSTTTLSLEVMDPRTNCGEAWNAIVYAGGSQVVYNNLIYQAAWETKSTDEPGQSDVWKLQGPCPGASFDCTGYPEWEASNTYQNNGMWVTYNNNIYAFQTWWSTGQNPESNPNVWQLIGACDSDGNTTTDTPPSISFTQPTQDTFYGLNPIAIEVNATDDQGTPTVQIQVDGSTYNGTTATLTPSVFGEYTIIATATDNAGQSNTVTKTITVQEEDTLLPPVVNFTSPSNGSILEMENLSPVTVTINATDADGSIVSSSITVENQTYNSSSISWTPSAFGTYTLSASTTDNDGLTATTEITVTIEEISNTDNGCGTLATYAPYPSIYMKGDQVTYEGYIYESMVDNLYNVTPGTADHWWKPIGPCGSARLVSNNLLDHVLIYPQPFQSSFRIDWKEKDAAALVVLYNQTGQSVLRMTFKKGSPMLVDTSMLSPGLYFVNITSSKGTRYQQKVLKR